MTREIFCPKCGEEPVQTMTRFGPRLDCCGLWAWGHHPLADRETEKSYFALQDRFETLTNRLTVGVLRDAGYIIELQDLDECGE